MKLIAHSSDDIAGSNICRLLVDEFGFEKTNEVFDGSPVYKRNDTVLLRSEGTMRERVDMDNFNPEVCIVASRHKAESGRPTLTCHATGNFGKAELGGRDKRLALAPELYLREALLGLKKNVNNLSYTISLEVTHHGPTELNFPVIFVEVGSTEEQWNDLKACRVVAKTIDELLTKEPENVPVAIGFGGPHYAPNFSRVIDKVALGHIAPKYVIDLLDEEMIKQMLNKTTSKPVFALLDWKGLKGEQRKKIIRILDDLNIEWKKTSEI